jgi:hypothetical protein
MNFPTSRPVGQFNDINGKPLEDGRVWFGQPNLDPIANPITVYWDAAGTQPVTQPVQTIGGYPVNGTTRANVFVNSDYSVLVRNRNGFDVFSAAVMPLDDSSANQYFLQAGAGAVVRTAQAKMRDVVSVKDFGAVGDGVTDDVGAVVAALTESSVIVFPQTDSGYAFKSNATVTLTQDTTIDFAGQAVLSTASRLTLKGQVIATGRTLAANAARYATSITLNSGTSIQRGDLLYISTTQTPSTDWSDKKQDTVRVSSISGAAVTLDAGLNFSYDTADTGLTITVYRPVKVTIKNANITLTAAEGDTTSYQAIWCEGVSVEIESPVLSGVLPFNRTTNIYRTGILLYCCYDWKVTNPTYTALSYPIGVYGGSRKGLETNVTARYCHHAHADLGGWSSDYQLIGLISEDGYQSLNTHPCFRAHASNFIVRNDYGLSNWRVCGGSILNGTLQTAADDTMEQPQFQNTTAASGYSYINDDADFIADNVVFDAPNRSVKAAFSVRYGRMALYSKLKGFCIVGLAPGELALWICGSGNQFAPDLLPSLPDNLVYSTLKRIDVAFAAVETIASASTISPKIGTGTVYITGTTSILNITATGFEGQTLTLIFQDPIGVADGGPGNLRLAGNFFADADDTLTLRCRNSLWYEMGRSSN